MGLFTEAERKSIAQAIAKAESGTSGELVVVHTPQSSDYALHRAVVSFFGSLALVDGVHYLFRQLDPTLLLLAVAALGGTLFGFTAWGPLLRLMVPSAVRADRAMERAMRAMIEEGVTETRDRSGVLIFLSEVEHRVVILADHGINEHVESDEWDRDVRVLVDALKAGRAASGLLEVIQRIGSLLSESFPPRADDTNELANEPRRV